MELYHGLSCYLDIIWHLKKTVFTYRFFRLEHNIKKIVFPLKGYKINYLISPFSLLHIILFYLISILSNEYCSICALNPYILHINNSKESKDNAKVYWFNWINYLLKGIIKTTINRINYNKYLILSNINQSANCKYSYFII